MMKGLSLVVAVDAGWGIGCQGNLLARVKADLANFRELTTGKTVILGAKTLSTFPGGLPLKNRRNIILSRRPDFSVAGAVVAPSVASALSLLLPDEEAVVIGGASIYRQFLPYCDVAYVTKFDRVFSADAFFPNLDVDPDWRSEDVGTVLTSCEGDEPEGLNYRFCRYRRIGN